MRSNTPYSDTVIIFDIHGVLFQKDWPLLIRHIAFSPYLLTWIRYACRPTLWFLCARLWWQSRPIEQYLDEITTRWPQLASSKSGLIAIANSQKPHKHMIDLVRDLKERGYVLHILSNIGEAILVDLVQRFPEVFMLFEHTVTTSKFLGYPSKRQGKLFEIYRKSVTSLGSARYIFIDDSRKNIETGKVYGLIGVYACTMTAVQSRLKELDINYK